MTLDYAARNYLSNLVRNTKRQCMYWNRYKPLLIPLLTVLLTSPELAAVLAGYAAMDQVCQIVESIPDPLST